MKKWFKCLKEKVVKFSCTPMFSCVCMLGLLICNVAIGRCIPGFNHEPKFPDEILK